MPRKSSSTSPSTASRSRRQSSNLASSTVSDGQPRFGQPAPSPSGGHAITPLRRGEAGAIRTPVIVLDTLIFENYDDRHYGYLRITVTAKLLKIEFHPAEDGSSEKTPDDRVAVDLTTRKLVVV